jgi:hypothetical protein
MTTPPLSGLNQPADGNDAVRFQNAADFERESGELVLQLGEVLRKQNHDEPLGQNEIHKIQRINRALYPLLERLKTLGYVHTDTLQLNENDELIFTA